MKGKKMQALLLAGVLCMSTVTAVSGAEFQDAMNPLVVLEDAAEGTQVPAGTPEEDDVQPGTGESVTDDFTAVMEEELYSAEEEPDTAEAGETSVFTNGEEKEPELFSSDGEENEEPSLSGTEEGTEGLVYEYIEETDSYRVIKGVDQETVKIPTYYQGKYVTEIGEEAFAGCEKLNVVHILNGYSAVTVRERAFENCIHLEIVNIYYAGIVESNAFYNCPELRVVGTSVLDRGYEENYFAKDAFDPDSKVVVSCSGFLKQPEGNEYLVSNPEDDFSRTLNGVSYLMLESEIIEGTWGTTLAMECDNSRESIDLEKGTMVVWRRAFEGADKLKEINLDTESLLLIAEKAFSGCANLKRAIVPETVQEIADNAFENCPNLTLYVTEGSYAEQYAVEHQIPYAYTPKAPEIEKITVSKNVITVQFSEFIGDMYYCVLGTRKTVSGTPVRSNKNARIAIAQTGNKVVFRNVNQGTYYIGARALKIDGGEKVYSEWSELGETEITVTTPERPAIASVSQSGSSLRITPSIPDGAKGYVVFLSKGITRNDSSTAAVAVPSQRVGLAMASSSKTAVLKNVKPGSYYVIIQSFNRNADGSKSYSQCSPVKRITVK